MSEALAPAAGVLHAAVRTDPGRVRANNEDLPLADPSRGIYGVIDGVGGSAGGEIAAAIAREVILQRLGRPLGTPAERVREAIAIANNEIFRRSERAPELRGMSCVVTLAIVSGDVLTVGHVGDSRLYTIGPQGLRKHTHDHSPVGEREDARELSEMEAMRHPRRNELFREVGGALRDKDDDDFVEVIDVPWDADQAVLLCTDGLTDMVPSSVIQRIVRRHAGQPQQVADALVAAANEAGGHDNVTVVYAEGVSFSTLARQQDAADDPDLGTAPGSARPSAPRARGGVARVFGAAWSHVHRFGRWVVASRTTWFALGVLAGVAVALHLVWRIENQGPPPSRTLVVGSATPASFPTIGDALAVARPGDVVSLEPGVYAERIVVPDGVDLVARVPGTATMTRTSGSTGPWVAITARGTQGGRLAGIRIASTPEAPIDVGVRIGGQGRVVELLDVTGAADSAVELLTASSAVVRGSVFEVPALAVRLEDGAHATLANSIVSRAGPALRPPLSLSGSARLVLSRNVISGFGPVLAEGTAAADHLVLDGNLVLGLAARGGR